MAKSLMFWSISASMLCLCFGCGMMTHNAREPLKGVLTLDLMNAKLETEKLDLARQGQCPGTLALKVVNVEKGRQRHVFYRNVGHKHYVLPAEFMDLVAMHFENKFIESKLTVDKQNGKPVLVSFEKANVDGSIVPEANLTIKIEVPGMGFTQRYSTVEGSASAYHALAYCVHLAADKFVKEPAFQQFVQCR